MPPPSTYGGQPLESSASMEQGELVKMVEDNSSVVYLSVKSMDKIADEWRELSCAPVSESEAGTTDDEMKSLPSPPKPPPPGRGASGPGNANPLDIVPRQTRRIKRKKALSLRSANRYAARPLEARAAAHDTFAGTRPSIERTSAREHVHVVCVPNEQYRDKATMERDRP